MKNESNKELTDLHDTVSGITASTWLPSGFLRNLILIGFVIAAVHFLIQSSYLLAILMLVIASLFSPRAMGEVAHLMGRIAHWFDRQ